MINSKRIIGLVILFCLVGLVFAWQQNYQRQHIVRVYYDTQTEAESGETHCVSNHSLLLDNSTVVYLNDNVSRPRKLFNATYICFKGNNETLSTFTGYLDYYIYSQHLDNLQINDTMTATGVTEVYQYQYWVAPEKDRVYTRLNLSSTSDNEFYVYYSTTENANNSNGEQVFEFYDDFNDGVIDTSKWVEYDDSNNYVVEEDGVLKVTTTDGGWGYGVKTTQTFSRPFIFELRGKTTTTTSVHWMPVFWGGHTAYGDSEDSRYQFGPATSSATYLLKAMLDGSATDNYGSDAYTVDTWITERMIIKDTGAEYHVLGVGEPETSTTKYSSTDFDNEEVFLAGGWAVDYYDYFLVRKYTSSPPTVTYGAEETGSWVVDGVTFTKRRLINITTSTDLTDYQVELNNSMFNNDYNIRITEYKEPNATIVTNYTIVKVNSFNLTYPKSLLNNTYPFTLITNLSGYYRYKVDLGNYSSWYSYTSTQITIPLERYGNHTVVFQFNFSDDIATFTWDFINYAGFFILHLYDETTLKNITVANISVLDPDYPYKFVYNLSNNQTRIVFFSDKEKRLVITADGYRQEEMFLYVQFQLNQTVDVYLLNESKGKAVTFTLKDDINAPISGGFVDIYRFYPSLSSFVKVTTGKTDEQGNTLVYLEFPDVYYKVYTRKHLTSEPYPAIDMPFIAYSDSYNVYYRSFTYEPDSAYAFENLVYRLNVTNNTRNLTVFKFFYQDTTGIVTKGCLKVFEKGLTKDFVACYQCLESSAGEVQCEVNRSLYPNKLKAIGWIETSTSFSQYPVVVWHEAHDITPLKSKTGLFMAFVLSSSVLLTGIFINAILGIILFFVTLIISINLNLLYLSITSIVGAIILTLYIILKR